MSWSQNHHEPSRFVWWWSGEASLGGKLTGLPEWEVALERWWTWKLQNSGSNSVKSCIIRDNFPRLHWRSLLAYGCARAQPHCGRRDLSSLLCSAIFKQKMCWFLNDFLGHFHLKNQLKEASSYIVYLSLRGISIRVESSSFHLNLLWQLQLGIHFYFLGDLSSPWHDFSKDIAKSPHVMSPPKLLSTKMLWLPRPTVMHKSWYVE